MTPPLYIFVEYQHGIPTHASTSVDEFEKHLRSLTHWAQSRVMVVTYEQREHPFTYSFPYHHNGTGWLGQVETGRALGNPTDYWDSRRST